MVYASACVSWCFILFHNVPKIVSNSPRHQFRYVNHCQPTTNQILGEKHTRHVQLPSWGSSTTGGEGEHGGRAPEGRPDRKRWFQTCRFQQHVDRLFCEGKWWFQSINCSSFSSMKLPTSTAIYLYQGVASWGHFGTEHDRTVPATAWRSSMRNAWGTCIIRTTSIRLDRSYLMRVENGGQGRDKRNECLENQIKSRTPKNENLWQTCWLDVFSSKKAHIWIKLQTCMQITIWKHLKTNQMSCSLTC